MPFNFEAGLGAMAETIGKVSATALLEEQKAAKQEKLLIMGEDLKRKTQLEVQEKGAGFDLAKQKDQQTFLGSEGEKDRASRKETSLISAGATLGAARISADTQKFINQQNIDAQQERDKLSRLHSSTESQLARDATVERDKAAQENAVKLQGKFHTDGDGNLWSGNPADPDKPAVPIKDKDGNQLNGKDPEVARAMGLAVTANSNQIRDLTNIYAPEIRKLDDLEKSLQSKAGDAVTAKEKAAHAEELQKIRDRRDAIQNRFDELRNPLVEQMNEITQYLLNKGSKGAVKPKDPKDPKDLNKVIKLPGQSGSLDLPNPYEPPSGLINYG